MNFDEINKKEVEAKTIVNLNTIGKNIRNLRIKNKLTQQDLAFYIFSDKCIISNIERGVMKNMTIKKIIAIAEVFKINALDLFKDQ